MDARLAVGGGEELNAYQVRELLRNPSDRTHHHRRESCFCSTRRVALRSYAWLVHSGSLTRFLGMDGMGAQKVGPLHVLETCYGLDAALPPGGAARLVMWYSPQRHEARAEVRFLEG